MVIDSHAPSSIFTADFDYIELTDYRVILNSSTTSVIIHIIIIEINDTQLEKDEQFIVHLSFPGEPIPGVTLDPDKATVEIIEFDGGGTYVHKDGWHVHLLQYISCFDSWVLFA